MPNPLETALKRLAWLQDEIARVERFISDYREFSGEVAARFPNLPIGPGGEGNVSGKKSAQHVDKYYGGSKRRVRPDEIAQMVERVIREVGQPMTRGQIVEALERRDVDLPAADKARYVGTIIWRHKSIFINIEGKGYWLRDSLTDVRGIPPNTPYTDPQEESDPELSADDGSDLFG